jgi:hypothetical protein
MYKEKMVFPQSVEDYLTELINAIDGLDFFKSPEIPEGYENNAKVHFWNLSGEFVLNKFIDGNDLLLNDVELEDSLNRSIIGACLDSLLDQGMINTIENEEGENVFWITDKGKEIIK